MNQVLPDPLLVCLGHWGASAEGTFSSKALFEARLSLVDTLACMVAGARDPVPSKVAEAMRFGGTTGPAATVGGVPLPAGAAALVNGAAAHVLDWDDYEVPGSTHASAVLVPALLAVADLRGVTLGQLLSGYLVGYATIIAVARALGGYRHYLAGWHATATIGPLGAAAAGAHLLGLDKERCALALALATSTSAGLKRQFGSDAKPLHAGLAARAGVDSALFAHSGLEANPYVTEGAHGFLAVYGAGAAHATPTDLGRTMEVEPILRKPWPCCAYTHRAIEAALELAAAPDFDPSRIAAGTIRMPEPFFRVAGFMAPETPAETRFSVIACVASALLDGDVTPATFELKAFTRPELRQLMAKLTIDAYDVVSDLEDMSPAAPDTVYLAWQGGGEASMTVAHVRGGARKSLTCADILAKCSAVGVPRRLCDTLLSADASTPFRPADYLRNLDPDAT